MQSTETNSAALLKKSLKETLPENAFSIWIDPLTFIVENQTVLIHFPNAMHLEQFKIRYLESSKEILSKSNYEPNITLKIAQTPPQEISSSTNSIQPVQITPSVVKAPTSKSQRLLKKSDVNNQFTFDEFVVGPDNQMAYASCLAVAKEPSKQYNPLFLHGDTGLGKTHLLQAIANHLLNDDPDLKVIYTNCESFTNEFIEAIKSHTLDLFRSRYRSVDILIVDDIQFLADKRSTQEEFFHTFNDLIASDKQVIVSSDSSPLELLKFEDRLISRFSSGLVTAIESPKFETRLAIIQQKCKRIDMDLDESVMHFLAQRPISNVRELGGVLITLNAHVKFNKEVISVSQVKELFPQYFNEESGNSAVIDFEKVLSEVTSHFGVRLQDIQSKKRPHSIAYPRQIAMYLLRKLTFHSLEEIGAFLGGRDHSTVQYAQSKIEKDRKNDVKLDSLLSQLEEKITG